jgi:hypothetical protein
MHVVFCFVLFLFCLSVTVNIFGFSVSRKFNFAFSYLYIKKVCRLTEGCLASSGASCISSLLFTTIHFSQCFGSVTFRCGFGSADQYHWITDLDPALFFSGFHDNNNKYFFFFKFSLLLVY